MPYTLTREQLLERTFIHDTYSCIKGRGTHFGISRLEQHIRSESQNYTVPYYVMKMDIRGCHIVGDPSEWAELPHGANYRLRRRLMLAVPAFAKYGVFDMEYRRYFSL